MSEKVYCGNCRWYHEADEFYGETCSSPVLRAGLEKDNSICRIRPHANPYECNLNNDCKHFEQKKPSMLERIFPL